MTMLMSSLSWLDELVGQHAELESPVSFWWWGALVTISAVVKDNVWLDRHIHNLYPNIYVMLHADSGLKKGPPISMAKRLVGMVGNTRIISGRSSIQGIMKDLGTGRTLKGGTVINDSCGFICSSELSSSIVEDKVATTILTDLYDRQYNMGEWRSLLKMETFELKNPTLSMFTATNEAHSQDFFAKKDVQGGFFARTFIIYENKANRSNSLLVPLTNPPSYEASAAYLKELAKLRGPFSPLASQSISEEHPFEYIHPESGEVAYFSKAGIVYEVWYHQFKEQVLNQVQKDETGTLNRFGDSVLKVAMLLSLARAPVLTIDEQSMTDAIEACQRLIGAVRVTTLGSRGLSQQATLKSKIIHELVNRDNHQISRTMLLNKMMMHYSQANELDELLSSFEQAGIIKLNILGNQVIYEMPKHVAQEWRNYFAGKLIK